MSEVNEMKGNLKTVEAVKTFMFGGNATLTIKGREKSFTYKVSQVDDKQTGEPIPGKFFVGYLNGPDNESNYVYAGLIVDGTKFFPNKKQPGSLAIQSFAWTFERLMHGRVPATTEIWHEGRCGRCGRKLTVVESIENGFGPECITKVSAFAVMANQLMNSAPAPTPAPVPVPVKTTTPCTKCGKEHEAADLQPLEGVEGSFCQPCRTMVTSLARTQNWSNAQTLDALKKVYVVEDKKTA